MKRNIVRTITTLILVIAMAVGMTASFRGNARAATPINIAYAAGDDAKINGGPVYNVNAFVGVATTITTVKPTRSGCNFLGWTKTKNSGRVDFKSGVSATFTSATTLWPVWNANIAYAAGDGKFSNNSPVMNVSVTLGQATTAPTSVPSRSGYTCIGWSEQKGATVASLLPGSTITYTKPTTYWPVWKANSSTITYKLTWDPNTGGTIKEGPIYQSFSAGSIFTLAPPNMVKTGCELLGYSENKKDTSAQFQKGQKVNSFNRNLTLYAIWKGTVTYDPNGGKIVSGSATQNFVSEISFKMNNPKMVNGKRILLGFDTNPNATNPKYKVGQNLTLSSGVKLYAIWSQDRYQGRQAIVIFPGIGGSNLYDASGNAFFKYSIIKYGSLSDKASLARLSTAQAVFKRKNNGDTTDIAGFDNTYLPLYSRLKNEFYKTTEYEIVLYEYDWREDCLTTAKKFRDEVAWQYDSMVLIGHSMGGLVLSSYLTLPNEASKVEKAFFLGTPFLGAPLASYLFAGGDIDKFYPTGAEGMLKGMKALFELAFLGDMLAQVPSFYELLPDCQSLSKMNELSAYSNGINGLYRYKSDDIKNRIHSVHTKYWNGSTHVSNRVQSYYIVGKGHMTIVGGRKDYPSTTPYVDYANGDGTVPYISASYPSRRSGYRYETTADHTEMVSNTDVLNYIVSKIKQ